MIIPKFWITTAFAAALPFVSSNAAAQGQAIAEIGTFRDYKVALLKSSDYPRIGKAVLIRMLSLHSKTGASFAPQVLVACDASWISTAIQSAYSFDSRLTFPELLSYAKSQDDATPLEPVEIAPPHQSQFYFSEAILKRVGAICKSAAKEPRNIQIPIASTSESENAGSTIALLSGTATRVGQEIDIWARTTHFRLKPLLDAEGKHVELGGKPQMIKEKTDRYSLERRAFNCRQRSLATYQSAEYEAEGKPPTSWSQTRDKLALLPAVPGSVGEAQLDAVCALYGD